MLFAEEFLVFSPFTLTLSKGPIPLFPSLDMLGLVPFMLIGFGFFGFVLYLTFASAGTWIHCGLGDVLRCLTLLHKKKDIFVLIVEESLKVFTELL